MRTLTLITLIALAGCTDDRPLTQQEQAERIVHHIIEQTRKATRATCLAIADEDAGPNVREACKRALAGAGE